MAEKTERSLLSRVFSAIFFGVGGAAGSRLFMALANILLSQVLGQDVYGQYGSLNSTVNLFVTFAGMGISATVTRYVAAHRQDKALQGMYIRTLSWVCMLMSALLSLAMVIFARQISLISTGGEELTVYFRYVAAAVFFTSMASVEQSILLGFEQFGIGSFAQLLRCVLFCVLGYALSLRHGLMGSALAMVISHGAQYFFMLLVNHIHLRRNHIPLRFLWNRQTRQALLTFALPAFIAALCVLPIHWVGNAILTQTAGFAQVAVFSVAYQWMSYITYVPSQMGQMRPIYTDLYTRGKKKELLQLMLRTIVITSALATVIGIVVVAFSEPILGIYGAGYKDGQYTLAFMVLAAVFYTAQVQAGFLMQATGRMWVSLLTNVIWSVVLLVSFLGFLRYEARGYAIAYAISYGVTLLIQLILALFVIQTIPKEEDPQ